MLEDVRHNRRGGGRPQTQPLGDGPWDVTTERARIHVTVVTKQLQNPWGLTFLPNGDMLVTKRPGRLRIVRGGVLDPAPIEGMPTIRAASIGGSVPGMTDPVLYWVPSTNPGNIVSYTGNELPGWRGNLLLAAMSRALVRISFDAAGKRVGQERLLSDLGQRFRDVRQGLDGAVYLLTDERSGAMLGVAAQTP